MDSGQVNHRLIDVASQDVVTFERQTPVSEVRSSGLTSDWLVVRGPDRRPFGLLSRSVIQGADAAQKLGDLVDTPVVVLPAHFDIDSLVEAWQFQQPDRIDISGVIVVSDEDDRAPVAVWAGPSFKARLLTMGVRERDAGAGGAIDTALGGTIDIGYISRLCKYQATGQVERCGAPRLFPSKPPTMPDCQNPHQLAAHKFAW
jgi:hypothetical protein